jgi:hypothetical protein
MSRSIRNSAFSLRSRESSAASSVIKWRGAAAPVCGESPQLARLTQLSKVFAEMAKRLDASAMLKRSRVINSTAC